MLVFLTIITYLLATSNGTVVRAEDKKVGVYVMVSSTSIISGIRSKVNYSYNSKGLITEESNDGFLCKYEYNSNDKISKYIAKSLEGAWFHNASLLYDEKGRLKKIISNGFGAYSIYTGTFFYDNENRVVGSIWNMTEKDITVEYEYKYNSKRQVIKRTSTGSVVTYKYDRKGNVERINDGSRIIAKYKNNYNKNKLIKQDKTKFKYKKIKVEKKYVHQIKEQQWALQNPEDVQFVFPLYNPP